MGEEPWKQIGRLEVGLGSLSDQLCGFGQLT